MNDSVKLTCAACGQANRVPASRLAAGPKCGVCGAALADGSVAELDAAAHDKATRGDDLPLLVDYWAPWCGPCRMIAPMVEELANENHGSFKIGKMNIDENPSTPQTYGVSSIPTLMIFKNGQPVQSFVGVRPKTQLQQAIDAAKG